MQWTIEKGKKEKVYWNRLPLMLTMSCIWTFKRDEALQTGTIKPVFWMLAVKVTLGCSRSSSCSCC